MIKKTDGFFFSVYIEISYLIAPQAKNRVFCRLQRDFLTNLKTKMLTALHAQKENIAERSNSIRRGTNKKWDFLRWMFEKVKNVKTHWVFMCFLKTKKSVISKGPKKFWTFSPASLLYIISTITTRTALRVIFDFWCYEQILSYWDRLPEG